MDKTNPESAQQATANAELPSADAPKVAPAPAAKPFVIEMEGISINEDGSYRLTESRLHDMEYDLFRLQPFMINFMPSVPRRLLVNFLQHASLNVLERSGVKIAENNTYDVSVDAARKLLEFANTGLIDMLDKQPLLALQWINTDPDFANAEPVLAAIKKLDYQVFKVGKSDDYERLAKLFITPGGPYEVADNVRDLNRILAGLASTQIFVRSRIDEEQRVVLVEVVFGCQYDEQMHAVSCVKEEFVIGRPREYKIFKQLAEMSNKCKSRLSGQYWWTWLILAGLVAGFIWSMISIYTSHRKQDWKERLQKRAQKINPHVKEKHNELLSFSVLGFSVVGMAVLVGTMFFSDLKTAVKEAGTWFTLGGYVKSLSHAFTDYSNSIKPEDIQPHSRRRKRLYGDPVVDSFLIDCYGVGVFTPHDRLGDAQSFIKDRLKKIKEEAVRLRKATGDQILEITEHIALCRKEIRKKVKTFFKDNLDSNNGFWDCHYLAWETAKLNNMYHTTEDKTRWNRFKNWCLFPVDFCCFLFIARPLIAITYLVFIAVVLCGLIMLLIWGAVLICQWLWRWAFPKHRVSSQFEAEVNRMLNSKKDEDFEEWMRKRVKYAKAKLRVDQPLNPDDIEALQWDEFVPHNRPKKTVKRARYDQYGNLYGDKDDRFFSKFDRPDDSQSEDEDEMERRFHRLEAKILTPVDQASVRQMKKAAWEGREKRNLQPNGGITGIQTKRPRDAISPKQTHAFQILNRLAAEKNQQQLALPNDVQAMKTALAQLCRVHKDNPQTRSIFFSKDDCGVCEAGHTNMCVFNHKNKMDPPVPENAIHGTNPVNTSRWTDQYVGALYKSKKHWQDNDEPEGIFWADVRGVITAAHVARVLTPQPDGSYIGFGVMLNGYTSELTFWPSTLTIANKPVDVAIGARPSHFPCVKVRPDVKMFMGMSITGCTIEPMADPHKGRRIAPFIRCTKTGEFKGTEEAYRHDQSRLPNFHYVSPTIHDAGLKNGDSGAPLIDNEGRVVGLHSNGHSEGGKCIDNHFEPADLIDKCLNIFVKDHPSGQYAAQIAPPSKN